MKREMKFRPIRWAVRLIVIILAVNLLRLTVWIPGSSFSGALPELTADQARLRDELQDHVKMLATEIGVRNFIVPAGLDRATGYIAGELRRYGYRVEEQEYRIKAGFFRQEWKHIAYDRQSYRNLIAELPGTTRADEIVVIGAHYDSVALDGCRGANDNASSVAALLAMAKRMAGKPQARTIRFVAFANEEPPFFQTAGMGSHVYAKRCRDRKEKIVAMVAMDSLGYYSDASGSQSYPVPCFGKIYPDEGNFIAFVGNMSSAALVRQALTAFRAAAKFPSQAAALPEQLPGIGDSDQWSFWQMGYPAIMVTDTAVCRDPHYHTARDNAEYLDYAKMARVVEGINHVIRELAQ